MVVDFPFEWNPSKKGNKPHSLGNQTLVAGSPWPICCLKPLLSGVKTLIVS